MSVRSYVYQLSGWHKCDLKCISLQGQLSDMCNCKINKVCFLGFFFLLFFFFSFSFFFLFFFFFFLFSFSSQYRISFCSTTDSSWAFICRIRLGIAKHCHRDYVCVWHHACVFQAEIPALAENELLVQVKACGLSPTNTKVSNRSCCKKMMGCSTCSPLHLGKTKSS